MKKIVSLLIAIILITTLFVGCTQKQNSDSDKLKVVTTLFVSYDFARQVAGDNAEITLLLPPGTEAHSYEPTPQDIVKIEKCDVFIYNGGKSEQWVSRILNNITDKRFKVIKMTECTTLVKEEIKEGMEEEQPDHNEAEEEEFDEHVWTSPKNAIKIVKAISTTFGEIDSTNKSTYETNENSYIEKLNNLDKSFEDVIATSKRKTVVFGDRFPLRYFADAYSLDYFAAFPGCATETEASAKTVSFLIQKVKSEKIPVVFHIELSNEKMADIICEATGAKKLQLNVCHNLTKSDFKKGITYLDMMNNNVSVLKEALN